LRRNVLSPGSGWHKRCSLTGHPAIPALENTPATPASRVEDATVHLKSLRFGIPLLLAIVVIAGCGKKNGEVGSLSTQPGGSSGGNSSAMEQAAISNTMSDEPTLIEDGLAEEELQASLGLNAEASAEVGAEINASPIRPVQFWRRINRVERRFEFAFSDTDSTGHPTTALVTIHKHLLGTFNILAALPTPTAIGDLPPPPRDTSLVLIHKPLDDHWVRRVLFKRLPPPPGEIEVDREGHRRWRIAATSGVKVTSKDATTEIVSLRIESGPLDTTVTHPLELFRLRRILKFPSGVEIRLTATTHRNDDVVVMGLRGMRLRFHNNGDNTYTAVFRASWMDGVHHLGVNALAHGTLFDAEAAYDSQAWILPYIVVPTELAEFLPR
jgi:hypothetical protein